MSSRAMRTAIVSDIHSNRIAFEAMLKDSRETAPDLILHGIKALLESGMPHAEWTAKARSCRSADLSLTECDA
jgi:hypothetical protein